MSFEAELRRRTPTRTSVLRGWYGDELKKFGPLPTPQQKTPPERGFYRERMMGLEPTTFCMASSSTGSHPVRPFPPEAAFLHGFRLIRELGPA